MFATPRQQIRPEKFRILPQLRRDRRSKSVNDASFFDDAHIPTCTPRAKAKLDVLTVKKKSLAQRSGHIPNVATKRHRRAAHPVDFTFRA